MVVFRCPDHRRTSFWLTYRPVYRVMDVALRNCTTWCILSWPVDPHYVRLSWLRMCINTLLLRRIGNHISLLYTLNWITGWLCCTSARDPSLFDRAANSIRCISCLIPPSHVSLLRTIESLEPLLLQPLLSIALLDNFSLNIVRIYRQKSFFFVRFYCLLLWNVFYFLQHNLIWTTSLFSFKYYWTVW